MSVATLTALARTLARSDRGRDILTRLHQYVLESTGGVCSVVLRAHPRGTFLQATSGNAPRPRTRWVLSASELVQLEPLFRSREPELMTSLALRLPGLAEQLRTQGALLLPLCSGLERIGILAVGVHPPWPDQSTIEGLALVGDAFALALDRVRLERGVELQQGVDALLQAFSPTPTGLPALQAGLEFFCEGATRLFRAVSTSVWLHDREARDLVRRASSDVSERAAVERVSTENRTSSIACAMRSDTADVIWNEQDPANVAATVLVPLRGHRRALGTLVLERVAVEAGDEVDVIGRAEEVGRKLSSVVEHVQFVEEILRSRHELEATFNALPALVAVCDANLRVLHVNAAFARHVRHAEAEFVGRSLDEFVSPATAAWLRECDASLGESELLSREVDDLRLGGRFILTTRARSQDDRPRGLVMIAHDITKETHSAAERAALRERLAQSEKLAALGQFIAGIAHELNNPLQAVLGHLELLRRSGVVPRPQARDLRLVYREAERAAKIVRNLLVFAGSRRIPRRVISLNAVVTRAVSLRSGPCQAANISLVRVLEDGLKIEGDPLLLQQAVLNVLINAEQAVADVKGARIEVGTSRSRDGSHVVLQVRDNGPGIPEDVLPRIFEPFFTTKEVGQGTGLGLAITYGIIQEHAGQISVSNHPEGGACFLIQFPPSEVVK
ncbi:MAG: PAS domain-containing protein [Acidobacteria bacterium]|nr:PAS domain-containing protein [Acidobacteriota bacterium]